jgi:hypothetical protein
MELTRFENSGASVFKFRGVGALSSDQSLWRRRSLTLKLVLEYI